MAKKERYIKLGKDKVKEIADKSGKTRRAA